MAKLTNHFATLLCPFYYNIIILYIYIVVLCKVKREREAFQLCHFLFLSYSKNMAKWQSYHFFCPILKRRLK